MKLPIHAVIPILINQFSFENEIHEERHRFPNDKIGALYYFQSKLYAFRWSLVFFSYSISIRSGTFVDLLENNADIVLGFWETLYQFGYI